MTSPTFAYGSIYGPIVESPKSAADLKAFNYGWLNGPLVGISVGGAAAPSSPPAIDNTRFERRGDGRTFPIPSGLTN